MSIFLRLRSAWGDSLPIMVHVAQSGPFDFNIVLRTVRSTSARRAAKFLTCSDSVPAISNPPRKIVSIRTSGARVEIQRHAAKDIFSACYYGEMETRPGSRRTPVRGRSCETRATKFRRRSIGYAPSKTLRKFDKQESARLARTPLNQNTHLLIT
jgi:hypothetical protein